MRRREFITLIGGLPLAVPTLVHAQVPDKPMVGFLEPATLEADANFVAGFLQGLKDTGFVDGQNVHIEYRVAAGVISLTTAYAQEIVGLQPSVIFALGSSPAIAAKHATSTIPIVFATGADPVALGIVSNLSHPTENLTGVTNYFAQLGAKALQLLMEMLPRGSVIGAMMPEGTPATDLAIPALRNDARAAGPELKFFGVRSASEFEAVFADMVAQKVNGLIVGDGGLFSSNRKRIADLAFQHRLPAIYPQGEYSEAGGLISYAIDGFALYRVAGTYVGRILKGEKPANLPVLLPSKLKLIVNIKTAKALGIEIPHAILATADEVIE